MADRSVIVALGANVSGFTAGMRTAQRSAEEIGTRAQRNEGAVVKVGLANEEGFPHVGKLEFVDNQLDARTGSVRMRATLANPERALAPGLFARVQVGSGVANKAIVINDRAAMEAIAG